MRIAKITVFLAALIPAALPDSAAAVRRTGGTVVVENDYVSRTVDVSGGRLHSPEIRNKLTGAGLSLDSLEFLILLGSGRVLTTVDFQVMDVAEERMESGGSGLVVRLGSGPDSLEVEVRYFAPEDEPVLRKWLVIRYTGTGNPPTVSRLEVERFRLEGVAPSSFGYGLPVFFDDLFAGLEFPAGFNEYHEGRVTLTHYPGASLRKPLTSRTAVWGVSPRGGLRESFHAYLDRLGRRSGRGIVIAYSHRRPDGPWPASDSTGGLPAGSSGESPSMPGDLGASSLVLGSDWFDPRSLFQPDSTRFGPEFEAPADQAAGSGAGLGLRLSPAGRGLDLDWAGSVGLRPTGGGTFCLADSTWYNRLLGRLRELVRDRGVNLLEFVGVNLSDDAPGGICDRATHGHAAGPAYAVEAGVDSLLSIMDRLKGTGSPLSIVLEDGVPLSPWWLRSADYVWAGGDDLGFSAAPSLSARSRAMSYRDSFFYQALVLKNSGIPLSGYVTRGIVRTALPEGFPDLRSESLEDWTDNLVLTVGRGCGLVELLLDRSLLNEQELTHLRQVLAWAREKEAILTAPGGCMFGGNPAVDDPYGYAHFDRDRGLIFLRNPSPEPKEIKIDLRGELGFHPGRGDYLLRSVYPLSRVLVSGEPPDVPFPLGLIPDEVRVLEILPLDLVAEPFLTGPSYRLVDRNGAAGTFEIMTPSIGGGRRAALSARRPIGSVRLDGRAVALEPDSLKAVFDFDGGRPGETRASRAGLDQRAGGARFTCRLELDPNLRDAQLVLAIKGLATDRVLVSDWRTNGEEAAWDRLQWGERRWSEDLVTPVYPPDELFLRSRLSGREARVEVDLASRQSFLGSLSAYLLVRRRPVTSILQLTAGATGGGGTAILDLPGFDTLREVIPVLPSTDFDLMPR